MNEPRDNRFPEAPPYQAEADSPVNTDALPPLQLDGIQRLMAHENEREPTAQDHPVIQVENRNEKNSGAATATGEKPWWKRFLHHRGVRYSLIYLVFTVIYVTLVADRIEWIFGIPDGGKIFLPIFLFLYLLDWTAFRFSILWLKQDGKAFEPRSKSVVRLAFQNVSFCILGYLAFLFRPEHLRNSGWMFLPLALVLLFLSLVLTMVRIGMTFRDPTPDLAESEPSKILSFRNEMKNENEKRPTLGDIFFTYFFIFIIIGSVMLLSDNNNMDLVSKLVLSLLVSTIVAASLFLSWMNNRTSRKSRSKTKQPNLLIRNEFAGIVFLLNLTFLSTILPRLVSERIFGRPVVFSLFHPSDWPPFLVWTAFLLLFIAFPARFGLDIQEEGEKQNPQDIRFRKWILLLYYFSFIIPYLQLI